MELNSVEDLLTAAASRAVALAKERGADQAEAGASAEEGLSVTVRLGEIESVERQKGRSLSVSAYKHGSKGTASTGDLSERGIAAAVDKALSIARFTTEDPCAGLADAARLASDPPDLDLYHPWDVDVDAAAALALEAETAARGYDARISNSEGASASSGAGMRAYANSHGFVGAYPSSSHSIGCSVLANGDGQAAAERDYWYTVARRHEDLESAESIGRRAAERALRRLGARQIATRVVPVLYPPELARGLFGHLVAAIRGTSQYRRASFLLDAAGKPVFAPLIDIREEPHIPQAMASAPFDGEGVETRDRELVTGGVLNGYVLSSYSARRLGLETTGNAGGIHNLVVAPTAGPLESLIRDCREAFLVNELLGQGVNTVTGDYSRGAAGFWIENGEIAYPVNEVTVAGNLGEMFKRIAAVGSDVDMRGAVRSGSVLIEAMTVAGQ